MIKRMRRAMRAFFAHQPWDDYWYQPVVTANASGVDVSPDTALGATALWNGVTLISNALAVVPLRLYRRQSNGGRVEVRDDPRFRVVNRKPNRWMTSFTWRQMAGGHLLTRGNHYAQKVLRVNGQLDALVPLHPTRMTLEIDGSEVLYIYTRDNGTQREFSASEIHHVRGLSTNGVVGYCPVTVLREAMATMLATDAYAGRFFRNNATPPGGLKMKHKLADDAFKRLKEEWQAAHAQEGQHKIAILDQGMEWQQIGFSAEDSQLIASRTFNVQEAARCLNIPVHKLKELSHATFSNIEEQNIEWVIDTIQPWVENWEQQLDADLLSDREQSTMFFKFDLKGLLRGDSQRRAAYFQTRFNLGSLSPNEIRAFEDEDPIDDEGADRYYLQQNLMPLDKVDEILKAKAAPPPAPALPPGAAAEVDEEPDDVSARLRAFTPVLRDLAARLMHREITAAKRQSKKGDWQQFRAWVDEYYAEIQDSTAQQLIPLAASMAQAAGFVGAPVVRAYVTDASAEMALDSMTALKDILRTAAAETIEAEMDEALEAWRWSRPDAIAEREIVRASEMFTRKLLGAA